MSKTSRFTVFILLFALSFLIAKESFAIEPTSLISWTSKNYVPSWFEGKKFPVNQSEITINIEMISNNDATKGKLVDLKNSEIRWYIDGQYYNSGNGLKSITFTNKEFAGTALDIKISVEYFDESDGGSYFVNKYFSIPVSNPEVIIKSKQQSNFISKDNSLEFDAIPFFFNSPIDLLNFRWEVDGNSVNSNDSILVIKSKSDIPKDSIFVNLNVSNITNIMEQARKSIVLKVKK